MSFFSGLEAEAYDRIYKDRDLIKGIMSYLLPLKYQIIVLVILVFFTSLISSIQPIVVSQGVGYVRSNPGNNVLMFISAIVLMSGFLTWGFHWLWRRQSIRIISKVVASLASNAFCSAISHDLAFHDRFSSGKIVTRITSDTQAFGELMILTTDIISQIVEAMILLIVLLSIDWKLSLTLLAMIPILFIVALGYHTLARRTTRQGMRSMANVNATIKETVSGIAIAKNFRQETSVYEEFNAANQLSCHVNIRRGFILSIVYPTLNVIGGIVTAIMVYFGGLSATEGAVTVGSWYLFILSLDRFLYPVMHLSSFWTQIQNGLSAAERVFALMDAESNVVQTDSQKISGLKGKIDFINVSFRYKNSEPVLDKFTLHISPGENLALVGHSGAGKTSIAKLIERFYEFQAGQILIDGMDIRSLDLVSYRRQLGIVTQTPFLFSGTVIENIRYAQPQASDKSIMQLANNIGNGEWLDSLPKGLSTQVGERGSNLSMGQRQLIALMRVLTQSPVIFILDEATASIDPFTEYQIQQALNLILRKSTSILIAHRLSTIKNSDRIITLEKGKIVEEGNHNQLMGLNGHYAMLYDTYFRHQSLEYIEQVGKAQKKHSNLSDII